MEQTVSDNEFSRLPTVPENAYLAKKTDGIDALFLGLPVVLDDNRIVVSEDWKVVTLTLAAQPDVPRNLTVALTDANNSVTGLLTITGEDPMGRVITETMEPDGAGGGKTLTGTKIFAKVTSAIISVSAGELNGTDVIIIGVGNVIGVPFDMAASAAVKHVYLGPARIATPTVAIGVSTSGIDVSAGTYDGAKVLYALVQPQTGV